MATWWSYQSGNFTSSSTWRKADAVSYCDGSSSSYLVAGWTDSPTWSYTGQAPTVLGMYVRLRDQHSADSSIQIALRNADTGQDLVVSPWIPIKWSTTPGWVGVRFSSGIQLQAGVTYRLRARISSGYNYICGISSRWSAILPTDEAGTPSAGDNWYVFGGVDTNGNPIAVAVTYDYQGDEIWGSQASPADTSVAIGLSGTVSIPTPASSVIRLYWRGCLAVYPGGKLVAGSGSQRLPDSSVLHLRSYGAGSILPRLYVGPSGSVELYGATKASQTLLLESASAGSQYIRVSDVTGWQVGDTLLIATSPGYYDRQEVAVVSELLDNGWVKLGSPLAYAHPVVDPGCEVANATRNIRISSESRTNSVGVEVFSCGSVILGACELASLQTGVKITGTGSDLNIEDCSIWDGGSGQRIVAPYGDAKSYTLRVRRTTCHQQDGSYVGIALYRDIDSGGTAHLEFEDLWILRATSTGLFSQAYPLTMEGVRISGAGECAARFRNANTASSTSWPPFHLQLGSLIVHDVKDAGVSLCPYGLPGSRLVLVGWQIHRCGLSPSASVNPAIQFQDFWGERQLELRQFTIRSSVATVMYCGYAYNNDISAIAPRKLVLYQCDMSSSTPGQPAGALLGRQSGNYKLGFHEIDLVQCSGNLSSLIHSDSSYKPVAFFMRLVDCDLSIATPISENVAMATSCRAEPPCCVEVVSSSGYQAFVQGRGRISLVESDGPPGYAEKLQPVSASVWLYSSPKLYRIGSQEQVPVRVWVRTSVAADGASYNGGPPELVLMPSPELGVDEPAVLATYDAQSRGWQKLSATVNGAGTPSAFKVAVRCRATQGWIYVAGWQGEVEDGLLYRRFGRSFAGDLSAHAGSPLPVTFVEKRGWS